MSEDHDEDRGLFRQAMADVRPLRQDRVALRRRPPSPVPRQRIADERQVIDELLTHEIDPDALETGEELFHARPGVQRRVLRKMRRGHYRIQDELDLHGLTVPLAHAALREFLAECRLRRRRCVRVIHGKGRRSSNRGPVLKARVDRWLRQWDEVIAFCSARPADGGTGAVYVLLRA